MQAQRAVQRRLCRRACHGFQGICAPQVDLICAIQLIGGEVRPTLYVSIKAGCRLGGVLASSSWRQGPNRFVT
jgi:hypothetical protein